MSTYTTVQDIIRSSFEQLTPSERQLATALTSHYPMSALGSITAIAGQAGVSTPTVVRMVRKLGFKGFPDFQAHIHDELESTLSNPITKHDRWANDAPDAHILNRFAEATIANLRETLSGIRTSDFDRARDLLKDQRNHVYIVGGRITKSLAEYLFTHCQVIRPNVTLIAPTPSTWPHYALNMKAGDVLVIFDIRRYERESETLNRIAAERGVRTLLFTDRWKSPIAKTATVVFRVETEVPSAWDSSVVTMFVVEALIEAIQSSAWKTTRGRMKDLEGLLETSQLFRKPRI
ncbi:MurR/RpiR family transcriptional regulator (plasmid) [Aminobacter sp. NyZ550]|uniref:MurR/RpiR family transcriptional regulator n=1 Tax=unclassified Aminobacter TaxID=2644704 RepID=UPI0021D58CBD|nr:MurR/RpiR family transcriptional regulator [Aminobacter sp. NyZ550]WAX98729.1 MurR/RpiR family transcriptional regulator [Aminobacter sp. NyZ550]